MSIYVVNIIRRGRENGTSIKSKELNDNVLSTLSIRSLSWKKFITFIIQKTDLDLGKKRKKKHTMAPVHPPLMGLRTLGAAIVNILA